MFQTIQISSCLSIQGEFVEALANGQVVVRDGESTYRGRPINRVRSALPAALVQALDFGAVTSPEGV